MLTVAPATTADLDPLVALLARQLADHSIDIGEQLRVAIEGLLGRPDRGVILVARDGGGVIGVAVVATTWTLERGGLTAWLDELYVRSERRGAGVGGQLLDAVLAWGRAHGVRAIELEVDEDHARAAHLYARAGFQALPRRRWALLVDDRER